MKILIAGKYKLASGLTPDATVEAEYGDVVVEGRQYTLAHHAQRYRHMPAPCLFGNLPSFDGDILISHIDLDTVGGCLALYGRKPDDDRFWQGAAFVDTRGPHRIIELPARTQGMLQAYWAFRSTQERAKYGKLCDVTDVVLQHEETIKRIIAGDPDLIGQGKTWAREIGQKVESCLVSENERLRAFKTGDVFCNAAYYSPSMKKYIPAIVSWNTETCGILISFEDGGAAHDASAVAGKLWGVLASGHVGIAGSPRGWELPDDRMQAEFDRAIAEVLSLLTPSQ